LIETTKKPTKGTSKIPDFPGALKATCLDWSRRGDGHHGVFLIEAVNKKKYIVKCYGRKRSKWGEILTIPGNYLTGRSSSRPLTRFNTEKEVLHTYSNTLMAVPCFPILLTHTSAKTIRLPR
jgi:hypothetical protein